MEERSRTDAVNDNLILTQRTCGLTFGTDALLLAAFLHGKYGRACEFGTGSGIISLLLLTRNKIRCVTALDVQPVYAELAAKNAVQNGLADRMICRAADIRAPFGEDERNVDLVFSNPPYQKASGGFANDSEEKNIARHEVFGDIADFCRQAAKRLRFGGTFAVVYRPERLCDLLCAMTDAGIAPKRLTFVQADADAAPGLVLAEGRAGGNSGLTVTPPLLIYRDASHTAESEDMQYILREGSFPARFGKANRKGKSYGNGKE